MTDEAMSVGAQRAGKVDTAEVYRRHASELAGFATALVGAQDAEDVLSRAMVKCLASPSWRRVENPRAYLFRAVLNEASTFRRRAALRRRNEWRLGLAETVEHSLPRPEVSEAVARLSMRQRAVIVLTYWADLDPPAVADRLGISEGSVRRHLARARARLREVLHD